MDVADPRAARREHGAAPFAVLVVLCALTPAVPHSPAPITLWWALAGATVAVMLAVGVAGILLHRPGLVVGAPFLLFPAVQLLRASDGNATSGFTPLLLLPVLWFAFHGSMRLVGCAIACSTLVLVLPLLLVGAPQYPPGSARGSLLLLVVIATVGVLVHRLVAATRRKTIIADTSAERFRALFDAAPVGVALTDGQISSASRFHVVNRALCATLGREREELLALSLAELVHPEDLPMLLQRAGQTRTGTVELRLLAPSRRIVWAEVSRERLAAPTERAPQAVWHIQDVTADRVADTELLQVLESERAAADTLRSVDRQHRELLSSISHDLRTPVTAALGYAELLAEGDFGPLTEPQQKTIDVVTRSLTNLSRIINELTVIGPELSREPMPAAAISIDTMIDDAVQMVGIQAAMRNQRLVCHRSPQFDLLVSGDEVRLGRAVVNLLANAVKFTPEGGTVTVEVRQDRDDVAIAITDDGAGIPFDDQERIFDRFYRAPRASADGQAVGSGLGLAIVKAIAVQHGGSIDLVSAPGEGATFTLRLPLRETAPRDRQARAGVAPVT